MIIKGLEGDLEVKDVKKQWAVTEKPVLKDDKVFINKTH